MNTWCTVLYYSRFLSSIWRLQKIWSVVYLLRRNPHWWSLIVYFMNRINIKRNIFAKILREVDSSDIQRYLIQSVLLPYLWTGKITNSFHRRGNSSCFYIRLVYGSQNKQTPWPLVRRRTIPTDRPPFVSEIWCQSFFKNGDFWDVTPCGSCKNRRFGGT
jgi:hypothetical protein